MRYAPDPRAGMTPVQRGILGLLRAPRAKRPPDLTGARILAVQIAGMGDLLLAVPALRALRRGISDARVDLLTSAKAARAASGCPHLDEIHALDTSLLPGAGGGASSGWGALLSLIRRIRSRRYDLAANLIGLYSPNGAVRMGLFLRSLGAARLAGRDTLGTGTFFHHALEETLEAPRNERDANLALACLLGAEDPGGGALEVWPDEAEERRAEELARALPGKGPLVGVNPGADRPEKVWSEAGFLEVMRGLRAARGARFLLTGGPAEAALTARLAAGMEGVALDTVGRIGFHGTAALMRRMALVLTLDTAAVHLAWAAGAPAVALFKEENLGRYRPATERIRSLAGRERDRAAPLEIPPEEVLAACLERLDAGRGAA